ncbi:MAG: ferrochelatase [Parachlamydiaceae bacterium]
MTHHRTGVLLVNLGTPDSPRPEDVHRYLVEFLTDERVIDIPWLQRQLLVRTLIIPRRYKSSAKAYEHIWTSEGSPLLVYGKRLQQGLQELLGNNFIVELAMRYQNPSIEQTLQALLKLNLSHLIIVPLFPQYASATTGSVHQRVMEILSRHTVIPKLTFLDHFFDHPNFIQAHYTIAKKYAVEEYDHVLFSFHGLPERQILKADPYHQCLKSSTCCESLTPFNKHCYSAQCYATAHAIAERLNIPRNFYTICFQSRLGKEPWLAPSISDALHQCTKRNEKKVLVFCPSFVCDCLETLYEIGVEYANEFNAQGGSHLTMVEGLNDDPGWIHGLKEIILKEIKA